MRVTEVVGSSAARTRACVIVLVASMAAAALTGLLAAVPATALTPHGRILIVGNGGFDPANGVTGGSGTPADPYIIAGWDITYDPVAGGPVWIEGTDAHFVIRDSYIHGGGTVFLYRLAHARIENVTFANGVMVRAAEAQDVAVRNLLGVAGIFFAPADGFEAQGNRLEGPGANLEVGGGSRNGLIRENAMSVAGLYIWGSSNVTSVANTFPVGARMRIKNSVGIFASENTFTRGGIDLEGGTLNEWASHTITKDNLANGKPIYYHKNCTGLDVDGIPVGQLLVANCAGVRAANLNASDTARGIEVGFSRDVVLVGNDLSRNDYGLYAVTNTNLTVVANRMMANNPHGVWLWDVKDADVSGNAIQANVLWGIYVGSSQGVTIGENTVSTNNEGMYLTGSDATVHDNLVESNVVAGIEALGDVRVLRNRIAGNGDGVLMTAGSPSNPPAIDENWIERNGGAGVRALGGPNGTSALTVTRNTFLGNGDGMSVSFVTNAVTHHNSFENNTVQAMDSPGGNAWDDGYPSGGNHWSDYAGVDNCSGPSQNVCPNPDGIGDTPYVIDSNSQDRYPLMRSRPVIVIDTNPTGLLVSVDGSPAIAPYRLECLGGSVHTVDAPTPQGAVDVRYAFSDWSDGGEQTHTILCDVPRTITANFWTEYRLVLDTNPSGLILTWDGALFVTPLTFWCAAGSVHVVDSPMHWLSSDRRFVFFQWEDGSAQNPRVIVCDGARTYRAIEAAESVLHLDTAPTGLLVTVDGLPLATPYERWCQDGSSLMIGTISPQYDGMERYEFDHWSEGGALNHTITCTAPASYTAFFLGPFVGGPPSVTLLSPGGGEDWTGRSTHLVSWVMSDPYDPSLHVFVNLSVDGGTTFSFPLASEILAIGPASLSWELPLLDTATARVQVCVVDSRDLSACNMSDANFTIDSTRPSLPTTDPADGLADVSVQPTIVLTFSERMNASSVVPVIAITPAASGMAFAWDGNDQVLTITFASSLVPYAEYTLTVGCGAFDASDPGNALDGCPDRTFRLAFRTQIIAAPPVAAAESVAGAQVSIPVILDGTASVGEIVTWSWTIRSGAGAVLARLGGPLVSYAFPEGGTYRVTLTVTDAYGRTDEYSFEVSVEAGHPVNGGGGSAWILAVVTAAVLATTLLAASEPGRVAVLTATAGRVYARKPRDEKDSEIRGAILYYVRVHPGDTYIDIKRNLDLNDGVVTYHLARLEKDGLVRSAIRGARKRYYPAEMRVPFENGGELHEIQQRLLRLVAEEPGMPIAFLAEQLGVSEQLALYHLRKLAGADYVSLERHGWRLRAVAGTNKP